MAERVIPLTCVVQAGTLITAPQSFPLVFAAANVERIDVRVPPGPAGTVGFSINYGGGNFIPEGDGNWIIADNDYLSWPLVNAPDGGNWTVKAYNTDVINHTLYFHFLVNNLVNLSASPSTGLIGL